MCFKKIYNLIHKNCIKPIAMPKSYGKITFSETRAILKTVCNNSNIFVTDAHTNLTSKDEAKKFSEQTKVDLKQYIAENHDCDDFSFALQGYWSQGLEDFAFGIAWSQTDNGGWLHAFNIGIFTTDGKDRAVYIIEPQTNRWYTLAQSKTMPMYKNIALVII